MQCPHCRVAIHPTPHVIPIGEDREYGWLIEAILCPACSRLVLSLLAGKPTYDDRKLKGVIVERVRYLVHPKTHARPPCPAEVPEELRSDYMEACLVLADSPKASAALSRRCLQHLLRTTAGVTYGDLFAEIQQVLDSHQLPSHLADSVDAVRTTGNFAAHPTKSRSTGEIVDVEPGEAEWNLDTLESLFDFYFVEPEKTKKRRAALDAKLKETGKPPLR